MNYAECILISQMAHLSKEIALLENEGNEVIKVVDISLEFTKEELEETIDKLKENYKSLLKAVECVRSANIA